MSKGIPLFIFVFVIPCAACGGGDDGGSSNPSDAGHDGSTDGGAHPGVDGGGNHDAAPNDAGQPDFQLAAKICVDTINSYRATLSLPPLIRKPEAELCIASEARADSISGVPHSAAGSCFETGQNECPGWPSPAEATIPNCLAQMWAEGPGEDFEAHGHYLNMSSTAYTHVACGFYSTPNGGLIWSAQDFW